MSRGRSLGVKKPRVLYDLTSESTSTHLLIFQNIADVVIIIIIIEPDRVISHYRSLLC